KNVDNAVVLITNKIRTHPILDIYALKSQRTIVLKKYKIS
ncbi:MAG: hypothetical protein ACJAXE_002107, partial [Neolewinella sp.]